VPIQRADADARIARDRLQRDRAIGGGELGERNVEQATAVAGGIDTRNRRVLRFWYGSNRRDLRMLLQTTGRQP
jgi:hypothetical protein